ncbi:Rho guanine nucleotide exchange factor 33 [Plecturocebus cupreus]
MANPAASRLSAGFVHLWKSNAAAALTEGGAQEMHLEDTTRFCPKEERESEQTSFSDQNPRQDQKGGFRSSFRKLFKKKSSGSEYREKTNENLSMDPSPTKQDFFRNRLALANDLDQGTAV